VGNQNPHKIFELLKAQIEALAPPPVRVEVRLITTGEPALIAFDLPEMQAAARAYKRGWGFEPVFTRGGGSIPVVADFANLMHIPVVMMGYGLDDDGLHAPNESYSIEMFERGIETAIVYMEELAALGN
jgi:acetylornithine deacetylase/succinyl-diaminopimelate desuccinylase-like protein